MNAATWAARKQDATLAEADSWGEAWETDDIAYVAEHTEIESDEAIALALGRSLYAVWAIQTRIRTGVVAVTPRAISERQRVASSRTYTFIGDDVPADW